MKIHKFPFVDFSKNTVDFIENDTTLEVVVEEEIIQAVIEEQQETIIVSNDTIPQYNQQQLDDMLRDAFEKGKTILNLFFKVSKS